MLGKFNYKSETPQMLRRDLPEQTAICALAFHSHLGEVGAMAHDGKGSKAAIFTIQRRAATCAGAGTRSCARGVKENMF